MNIILVSEQAGEGATITLGAVAQSCCSALGAAGLAVIVAGGALHYVLACGTPPTSSIPCCRRSAARRAAGARHERSAVYMQREPERDGGEARARCRRSCCASMPSASGSPKIAGIKPQEFRFDRAARPRRRASSTLPPQDLSLNEFNAAGSTAVAADGDRTRQARRARGAADRRQPRRSKLHADACCRSSGGWYSSNFGWRIDPFTGQQALHEGIDFIADAGTPVVAAAGGVVVVRRTSTRSMAT